jgi:hypothetical protein
VLQNIVQIRASKAITLPPVVYGYESCEERKHTHTKNWFILESAS